MDWIKKNYDQALLGFLALAVIAVSVLLFMKTQTFGEKFAEAAAPPTMNRKLPVLDTAVIEAAEKKLTNPQGWTSANHDGLLFTSPKYIVNKSGALEKWAKGAKWEDTETGKLVPNEWLTEHGLPETDETVLAQDPDGDGFLNQDEWRNNTNPTKKESHPEYITKLHLNRWIKVPFRTKFQAYDGSPKAPEKMEFQINPLDAGGRTEFVKIGDTISGTKFKVIKFEFKETLNPGTGVNEDVSELTVVNSETSDSVTLVLNKVVDSPNQFAEFDYRWGGKRDEKGQIFAVPRLKEFVLKPLVEQRYKLLDVNATEAVVETPKGEKVSVKPYKASYQALGGTPGAPTSAPGAQPTATTNVK
jgi:hypothetical protein